MHQKCVGQNPHAFRAKQTHNPNIMPAPTPPAPCVLHFRRTEPRVLLRGLGRVLDQVLMLLIILHRHRTHLERHGQGRRVRCHRRVMCLFCPECVWVLPYAFLMHFRTSSFILPQSMCIHISAFSDSCIRTHSCAFVCIHVATHSVSHAFVCIH